MASTSSHHHQAPPGVQTHAQAAMQMYPELAVTGFEQSSQVRSLTFSRFSAISLTDIVSSNLGIRAGRRVTWPKT